MLRVAEVDQGIQVVHGLEHDVAAFAPVAAIGAAELDVFLAPERDHTIAAVAGAEVDLGLVEELHRWLQEGAGSGPAMRGVERASPATIQKRGRLAPTPRDTQTGPAPYSAATGSGATETCT